jgi:hypothetical protein
MAADPLPSPNLLLNHLSLHSPHVLSPLNPSRTDYFSFIQTCGDVLTKKKLDAHRNSCRGAEFSCLDCMEHFSGIQYRSHTVCRYAMLHCFTLY